MSEPSAISPPAFSPERFAERLAEAIRLANDPVAFARLPGWTRRVMLILTDQLVPAEYRSLFTTEQSILAEGVGVAWMAHARDTLGGAPDDAFAREVAQSLTRAPEANRVVDQIGSGAIAQSPAFRDHIMRRLFASSAAERRAFAEGLALGNRVHDLFARHARERSTDATRVYLMLWLYWPDVARLHRLAEAADLIERHLGGNPNLAGRNWEERFRKIANRIGLSYRAKQAKAKRRAARSRSAGR